MSDNQMTPEFTAALAQHVLNRAIEESPDNISARFAELWPKYQFAAQMMFLAPERAAARIAKAAEKPNNQPEN